jgi:hypothetical protein
LWFARIELKKAEFDVSGNTSHSEYDRSGSPLEVLRVFAKLGVSSFGGPIAHIGYFREEFVVRRRWIDEPAFADLVALCQFLPGPASSQVGFSIGLMRGGYLGGLAAWTAFTLPSAILLLLFAYGAKFLEGPIGSFCSAPRRSRRSGRSPLVAWRVWGSVAARRRQRRMTGMCRCRSRARWACWLLQRFSYCSARCRC